VVGQGAEIAVRGDEFRLAQALPRGLPGERVLLGAFGIEDQREDRAAHRLQEVPPQVPVRRGLDGIGLDRGDDRVEHRRRLARADRQQQVVAARPVQVDRPLADPRAGGDLLDADPARPAREQRRRRGVQERVGALPQIGPLGPRHDRLLRLLDS
jgi:hypothetical protein